MLFQERYKFLLEGHLLVVLRLAFDVLNNLVQLRHAYTEGAIFYLPAKESMLRKGFMHPFGGTAFDELVLNTQ